MGLGIYIRTCRERVTFEINQHLSIRSGNPYKSVWHNIYLLSQVQTSHTRMHVFISTYSI